MSALMIRDQSNEEFHARNCAIANSRTSIVFVAFCALEVYLSWRVLGKAFSPYNLVGVFRDIVMIMVCVKLLLIFRCFRERSVVGIVMLRYVISLASGFVPTLFNQAAGPIRSADLALWVLALIISLSMFVQSAQNPHIESQDGETTMIKRRFIILCAVIVAAAFLGALMYFVPFR
jgi:hypothetical protein